MSSTVLPYAWPMWSLPVTLGGGITITKRGEPAGPAGVNRPSDSQRLYHSCSNDAGSKVLGSFLSSAVDAVSEGISGIKKGLAGPSYIRNQLRLTRRRLRAP